LIALPGGDAALLDDDEPPLDDDEPPLAVTNKRAYSRPRPFSSLAPTWD
jgi:hypothetical protein